MDKKIGRVLFLCLIVNAVKAGVPHVFLDITDSGGHHITKIGRGIPFTVNVSVAGESRSLPQPHLEGLGQFERSGTRVSTQINSINGKMSVKETHATVVRATTEGTFTIGPASIEYNGQTIESETITLAVSADYKPEHEEMRGAFLTVHADKEEAFIGEPIDISIRFYQDTKDVKLEGIVKPSFEFFTAQELRGPETGTSTIDGKRYRYLEWTTTVYPQKDGDVIISPIKALYSLSLRDTSRGADIFSMMNSFLGGMREERELYSNTLKVKVKPLPSHEPEVKAVGKFSHFRARVNNATAGEGEGIVYTLELSGFGNFDQITHPEISHPKELTYYDSNMRMASISKESPYAKLFEYVIQGLESGTYTIPAQTFTFFDIKTEQYRTLTSEEVTVTITEFSHKKASIKNDSSDQEELFHLSNIEVDGPWVAQPIKKISWGFFFLVVFLPLVMWLMQYLWQKREAYLMKNAPHIRYSQAFKNAKIVFDKARASNYRGQLYHMFIELFGARLKKVRTEVSETLIEDTLREKGLSDDEIRSWRLLFARLAECAFSSHRQQEKDDYLFNKSAHWLNELEKIL